MKKTITANIGGAFFHVDEDAYDLLKNYLETIRGYFINTVGCDEIMADIESRIAEMFKATQNPNKEVITLNDVNNIIAVMGQPEDYLENENQKNETNSSSSTSRNYASNTSHTKRIFRDPDNRVLGGVCSGIGAYFAIDPVWIRIAFIIMFFAFGTGPFLYLILWLIIPKAKTAAEKLEMRGEPVTAENIGKTIREEMNGVKNSFETISKNFRFKKKSSLNSILINLINLLKQLIVLGLNIAGKIIGLTLITISLSLFIIFWGIIITDVFILNFNNITVANFDVNDFLHLFLSSDFDVSLGIIAITLLILIPVVTLIFVGIKLLFKVKNNFKIPATILAIAWITSIFLVLYCIYSIAVDFSKTEKYIQSINIQVSDTLYLRAKDKETQSDIRFEIRDDEQNKLLSVANDSLFFYYPYLNVMKSHNDSAYLIIKHSARGKNKTVALQKAQNIRYEFKITDNTLVLDNFFKVSTKDNFRAQKLNLTLKLPEGKTLYFDKSLENMYFEMDNINNIDNEDWLNNYWEMTSYGLQKLN